MGDLARCTVVEYGRVCAGSGLDRICAAIDVELTPHADGLVEGPVPDEGALPEDVQSVWLELLDRSTP